ncbi:MAG: PKD domain-containing protein [Bacteroidetes bacterium]|jgi:PKD repeat protein|nr:PKD domain-containing protein [Bacteroidota bacterium]
MKKQITCLLVFLAGFSIQGFSQPTFTISPSSGCSPVCAGFQDQTPNVLTWLWDFGDASAPSNLQSPMHCYTIPATYTVTLIETLASGTTTSSGVVTVFPNPVAAFTFTLNGNNNVSFLDLSTGGIASWLWNFGDAGTSQQQFPSHTYSSSGNETVCLFVVDANGCFDTACQTIMVTGMNEFNSNVGWNIFPNPSNGNISIQFFSPLQNPEMLRVENMLGELILQKEISTDQIIDLSQGPSGIYFVRIGNSPAKKLVIE